MAQGTSRPAWAEIDLAAITHNAQVLSQLVRPAQLCAVVKANGYGHGAAAVARAALAGGAIGLAVALVDEGVDLRRRGVRGPVLLLSECGAEAVDAAMANSLTPTLYTAEGVELFSAAAPSARAAQIRPRQGGHGHAPGGRAGRRGAGAPACRRRRSAPAVRGTLDPPGGGRRRERRATAPSHTASWRRSTACSADLDRAACPAHAGARRQHRRRGRPIRRRATAWCAAGSVSTATSPPRR